MCELGVPVAKKKQGHIAGKQTIAQMVLKQPEGNPVEYLGPLSGH